MSNVTETEYKPKIGITMGDVNGIGPEIIIKTFLDQRLLSTCVPVIYGSSKVLSYHRKALNISEFNFNTIRYIDEASNKKPNLINCWEEDVKIDLGKSNAIGGKYALKSLQAAGKDLLEKKIDGLVTAPIDKNAIQSDGFRFAGQTEFFAQLCNVNEFAMMMVSEKLRVSCKTKSVTLYGIFINRRSNKSVNFLFQQIFSGSLQ